MARGAGARGLLVDAQVDAPFYGGDGPTLDSRSGLPNEAAESPRQPGGGRGHGPRVQLREARDTGCKG